ncbi:MAG: hypothetical protein PHY88_03095 [Candidatus Omnitrophica bacterium]|nr:hypothetical protein [Candidatus Omnitrophota bacterium]
MLVAQISTCDTPSLLSAVGAEAISRLGLSGAFSGTLAFPQREMLRSGRRVALPHPGPRIKRVFG